MEKVKKVKVNVKVKVNAKPKPKTLTSVPNIKPKPKIKPKTTPAKHVSSELASSNDSFTSPPVKWVGGKTQSLDQIRQRLPAKIDTYIEPFLGGGSVLLMVLNLAARGEIEVENYIASDNNVMLINMYWAIQLKTTELLQYLEALKQEFMSITTLNVADKSQRSPDDLEQAKQSRESYYYYQRQRYNEKYKVFQKRKDIDASKCDSELAALFIFLNKTCFRGLHREGPNGMNVPYGNYKNPQIYYPKHIVRLSELLTPVIFSIEDFTEAIIRAEPGDFVYMDPPYVPEKQTSFTSYVKDGFKYHQELFDMCAELRHEKISFLLSNSNTPLVTDYFTTDLFTVDYIDCRRAINSKNPKARTKEVFITN